MLHLTVLRGAVRRIRDDQRTDVRDGRLDVDASDRLLATETATLGHRFGLLLLPAGREVAIGQLAECLSAAGHVRIEQRVAAALDGDPGALDELARALPLTRPLLRNALALDAAAPGAARLRALLAIA